MEVIGRYSNHPDQRELLEEVLGLDPVGGVQPKTPTNRQVHRRLREAQIEDLVEAYKYVFTVYQLADQFPINRETLSLILR